MNLILFETQQAAYILTPRDLRFTHITTVLRSKKGETLFIGVPQGPTGKAVIEEISPEQIVLSTNWEGATPQDLLPLQIVIGLPRPQTARKILQELSSIGVSSITFFKAQKGDSNYAQSSLWQTDEWESLLKKGAQQACSTTYPSIKHANSLEEALASSESSQETQKIALDIYEAQGALKAAAFRKAPMCLALGAERGWSDGERNTLRALGFGLYHLGPRVLRTETACLAATGYLLANYFWQ